MTVESNYLIAIGLKIKCQFFNQWKSIAPHTRFFPRFQQLACNCYAFWLVRRAICSCCDWSELRLWNWLFDSNLKTALKWNVKYSTLFLGWLQTKAAAFLGITKMKKNLGHDVPCKKGNEKCYRRIWNWRQAQPCKLIFLNDSRIFLCHLTRDGFNNDYNWSHLPYPQILFSSLTTKDSD